MGMRLACSASRPRHHLPAAVAAARRAAAESGSSSTPGIRLPCGHSPMTATWMRSRRSAWTGPAAAGAAQGRLGRRGTRRSGPRQVISSGGRARLPPRGALLAPRAGRAIGHWLRLRTLQRRRRARASAFCRLTGRRKVWSAEPDSGRWPVWQHADEAPSEHALIYVAGVAVAFLALAVGILWQPAPANDAQALCRDTGLLAAAAMAANSPHYHWYFAWLALPAVVAPSRALLWLATAPLLLIEEPVPGDRFFWPSLVYVPAILLLLADLRPWLAIKLRRGAENGETPCPL